MKRLLTAGLLLLSLAACKDRDADPNVLPPATQTGANTAGCLVDGKVWVASKQYVNRTGGVGTYAEKINNLTTIQLDLRSVQNKNNIIFIRIKIDDLKLNKDYLLPYNKDVDYNICKYITDMISYQISEPNYTGKIKITRLDIPKNIVCGTFEFDAVDKDGKVVHITEGRFDKKFD